ncbi:MAG: HAD-IB family hydrolase [Steroidobacteraceae bacterium]|nr:HAD-IB family hydrolase [Steroidobacteraceae bacterium]MDW8260436.1 HAD-IB family hydrolase [Gammaproteobacteria bacterium]
MTQLVFFDLDGTISRRDTLLQYLAAFLWRRPWRWPRLVVALPALWRFVTRRADRGELKGALLHAVLGGCRAPVIERHTERWIAQFVPRGCRADALAAVRAHQAQGDHLILMSASVDLYVPRLAAALGMHEAICTATRWRADGRYDGRLQGANCRDQEKARRMRERLRSQPTRGRVWAYGNSRPDLPHLRLAERAILVNAGRRLRAEAAALGIECLDWR